MGPDARLARVGREGVDGIAELPVAEKHSDRRSTELDLRDIPLAHAYVVVNGGGPGKRFGFPVADPVERDVLVVRAEVQQVVVARVPVSPDDAGAVSPAPP